MYFHGNDFVLICSCKVLSYLPSYPLKREFPVYITNLLNRIFPVIVQTGSDFHNSMFYLSLNFGSFKYEGDP